MRLAPLALAGLVAIGPAGLARGQVDDAPTTRPRVSVALLDLAGGGSDERPRAVQSLMAAVARRTSVEADTRAPDVVTPLDPRLFDHPLVVLSGSRPFDPLSDEEVDAMHAYLSLGGMVLVDDRSGTADSEFARRARRELGRALGGREFVPLRTDHAIYRSFYLLDRAWGRLDVTPELQALVLDTRAAVVFSSNDLLGAWARDEMGSWAFDVSPGGSRQRELAVRLGVNLLLYALTLDYKEDLVHLPLILERRR